MAKGKFQSKTYPVSDPAADRTLPIVPGTFPQRSADTIRQLLGRGLSESTKRAYREDLEYFWAWAQEAARQDERYPISVDLILQFVADHLGEMDPAVERRLIEKGVKAGTRRHSLGTVKRRLATLSIAHEIRDFENPVRHKYVRQVLRNAARLPGNAVKRKKAITADILEDMIRTCRGGLLDLRDRALLLTGFSSGGRRRSELAAMQFSELTAVEGGWVLHIPRSKTDQSGKGMNVPVFGPAAEALEKWIKAARIREGRLFRGVTAAGKVTNGITGRQIARIVKNRLESAGYDPSEYGAHSLRSGFITESGRQRISLADTMALTGHLCIATVLIYHRAGEVTKNPAGHLLAQDRFGKRRR
jgi:integrase